jgi:uridylate kinase
MVGGIIGISVPCRYNAAPMTDLKYQRVLLKISGEGLCQEGGFGLAADELRTIARECAEVAKTGVQLAIVVGGGNFIRGSQLAKVGNIQEATAHYMGMLGTVINALALQEMMEANGQPTRVMSAISVYSVCEPWIRRRAIRHMEKKRVIILAGGTGNPFFTTDTCAALRATELKADVVLKATKVDGIYSSDPKKNPAAELYTEIGYDQVMRERLGIMDLTAITMLMEQKMPLVVFNLKRPGNIMRVLRGEAVGTQIRPGGM